MGRRLLLLLASAVAIAAAFVALTLAMLPFAWAESGPRGFDVVGPGTFGITLLAAAALAFAGVRGILRAVPRTAFRPALAPSLAVAAVALGWQLVRAPSGARSFGGGWYVASPRVDPEAGGTHHTLHRRGALGWKQVDAEVAWFRRAQRDCIIYGHAYVPGDTWAACGGAAPVKIFDGSLSSRSSPDDAGVTQIVSGDDGREVVTRKRYDEIVATARRGH